MKPRQIPFTVIIPTYNRARFVGEAITSVMTQTLAPQEIIVVDDGSTDNTREVVTALGLGIRYVAQNNSGPSVARNTGILAASTEWLAFLDSDDVWLPNYLESQAAQIERYPAAVAHLTNSLLVHPNGRLENLYETFGFIPAFCTAKDILIERPLCTVLEHTITFTQTLITRRASLIEAGLFPKDVFVGEDLHLLARLAMLGSFSIIREPLVRIIRRQEEIHNLTALRWLQGIKTQTKYVQTHSEILNLPGLTWHERKVAAYYLSRVLRALGNLQMRAGHRTDAHRSFCRAAAVAPSWRSIGKLLFSYAPLKVWDLADRKARNVIP